MNNITSLSFAEFIAIATLLVGLISVVFVGIQLWQKVKMDHSKQVLDMMNKTRLEQDMVELLYQLDYNHFHYDYRFHQGGQLEQLVDNVLHYYEYILYLRNRNILNKKEFQFFEYDIQRIVGNHDMQNYFFTLYHFVKRGDMSFKYRRLLKYGRKHGWIEEDFYNKNSTHFENGLIINKT